MSFQRKRAKKADEKFQIILSDRHLCLLFRDFLKSRYSDESLYFYIMGELFKKLNPQFQKSEAKYIIDMFIEEGSRCAININGDTKTDIYEKFELDLDDMIFMNAQNECEKLMVLESMPKFFKTDEFLQYSETIQNRKLVKDDYIVEDDDLNHIFNVNHYVLTSIPRQEELVYKEYLNGRCNVGNLEDFECIKEKMEVMEDNEIFELNNIDMGYWNESFYFKSVFWSQTITSLSLQSCNLSEIPDLRQMKNLSIVNLSQNYLPAIPKYLTDLTRIESLQLANNEIYSVPNFISTLVNLHTLILHDNNIQTVGEGIGNLENLKLLDLSRNNLIELPSSLSNCKQLSILLLDFNKLWKLYDCISDNQNLKTVSFLENRCTIELPFSIIWLDKLYLDFSPNQYFGIPMNLSDEGGNLILVYTVCLQKMGVTKFDLKYHWKNNVEEGCYLCKNQFSKTNPFKHCRCCGNLVDKRCSSGSHSIDFFGVEQPVKCCDICYTLLSART